MRKSIDRLSIEVIVHVSLPSFSSFNEIFIDIFALPFPSFHRSSRRLKSQAESIVSSTRLPITDSALRTFLDDLKVKGPSIVFFFFFFEDSLFIRYIYIYLYLTFSLLTLHTILEQQNGRVCFDRGCIQRRVSNNHADHDIAKRSHCYRE